MGAFLAYSLVSGLMMLCMLLAYKSLLAKEKQHGYNRGVLLGIYAVSFAALPTITAVQRFLTPGGAVQHAPMTGSAAVIETIEIAGTASAPADKPVWGTILIWIFLIGMIAVAAKTIITWVRLMAVIRRGEKVKQQGYTLVLTDDERFAPFSWMNYIVISRADNAVSPSAIATHELKHIACHHWIDLLIAQAVCIVNWFNPAAWLMRDELMLVHEYQADMAVIDGGHNPQEYQMLLIKKAVGASFPSLANSLNHSKLKKRITMMYKEKNGVRRKLRVLALVPMLPLALAVAAVPTVRAAISTISSSEVSVSKDSKIIADTQAPAAATKETRDSLVTAPEVMPEYPGGQGAIFQHIIKNLKFPDPDRQWEKGEPKRTVVGFTVNKDGTTSDFVIQRSCGYDDLDAAAMKAVKESMTSKWTPATVNGQPVAVKYNIPISFRLNSPKPAKPVE